MTEPKPNYTTNATYTDADLVPAVDNRAELMSAYRAAVSTASTLQNLLQLPPEQRAVINRAERRRLDKE